MEVAWAATNTHPYLFYPAENMRIMCVAKNIIKIGEVLYRKLFKRGAFDMVRDPETGMFRPWNPKIDGWDKAQRVPCIPPIDERAVKTVAWERKGLDCPKKITLNNGCEITFWTADGKPPNGVDVDLVWFDEEVESQEWYDEMSARLIDRSGRFIWSATPQVATDTLWDLHERAQQEKGALRPKVEEFQFLLDDNPFLPPEAVQDFKEKAAHDPENYEVRVLGKFKRNAIRVFPDFSEALHVVDSFQIPSDWCHYLVVDPGFTNSVAIFFAVPPPKHEMSGHVYVYDSLYSQSQNVRDFANKLAVKVRNVPFQAFLIDDHGSRRSEVNGKTIKEQYAEQFKLCQLRSIETQSDFIPMGRNEEKFGKKVLGDQLSQVRRWIWTEPELGDRPVLQVFRENTDFIYEMKHYSNKVVDGKVIDEPNSRKHSHGPDCFRYAVLHGLPYVKPQPFKMRVSGIKRRLEEKARRRRSSGAHMGNYVIMGQRD